MPALLAVNLAAALFLAGVAWFVQLVHYPLLAGVGPSGFRAYHDAHRRRTAWVVVAPMLVELAGAVALVAARPSTVSTAAAWAALALVGAVWASTFGLQVPAHDRLERGFDATVHRRLVRTSWIRTAAWSARAALLLGVALA